MDRVSYICVSGDAVFMVTPGDPTGEILQLWDPVTVEKFRNLAKENPPGEINVTLKVVGCKPL